MSINNKECQSCNYNGKMPIDDKSMMLKCPECNQLQDVEL